MSLDPFDRRELFAGAGGLFLCTLAGKRVFADREADVSELAAGIEVPPKVATAEAAGAQSATLAANRAPPVNASTGSAPSRGSGTSSPAGATR